MMDDVETIISHGMRKASKNYAQMTEKWLHHAPEHFIQIVIALKFMRHGYYVYPDIAVQKSSSELDTTLAGSNGSKAIRKLAHLKNLRPDLTIWSKTDGSIISAIEIKRTWDFSSIKHDIDKLNEVKNKLQQKSSYILVYSDAAKTQKTVNPQFSLKDRFGNWSKKSRSECITSYVCRPANDGSSWGFCLLKL